MRTGRAFAFARAMIPQSFVQELLSRVDIVDVIERYVPLKKSGANYFACCPFHGEKSASFSVSPSKQFYHCFGCGVHGSAVGFLMEYSGLGFVDAVKELAAQVGLQVPDDGRSATPAHDDASERLYEAMAMAARGFYTATEFDLSRMPGEILASSVEVGRACIAREPRASCNSRRSTWSFSIRKPEGTAGTTP